MVLPPRRWSVPSRSVFEMTVRGLATLHPPLLLPELSTLLLPSSTPHCLALRRSTATLQLRDRGLFRGPGRLRRNGRGVRQMLHLRSAARSPHLYRPSIRFVPPLARWMMVMVRDLVVVMVVVLLLVVAMGLEEVEVVMEWDTRMLVVQWRVNGAVAVGEAESGGG